MKYFLYLSQLMLLNAIRLNLFSMSERLKMSNTQEVKPGLSSFADDPEAGAETIQALINEAHALVPAHQRKQTPVSLKATAG